MTKLTVRVKDKDIGFLCRLAKAVELSPDDYVKEVVEAWLAEKRDLSAQETTLPRSSSLIAGSAVRWPSSSATRATLRFV